MGHIKLDEKSYENILVYDISCKTLIAAKPLSIRFNKEDGFIRVYDETRYVVLFGPEKYDAIYSRIRYLVSLKSGITNFTSHKYVRIKIDSYNVLPLEEILTDHNVITVIKSVFNKDQDHYYHNIFLEKCSYK